MVQSIHLPDYEPSTDSSNKNTPVYYIVGVIPNWYVLFGVGVRGLNIIMRRKISAKLERYKKILQSTWRFGVIEKCGTLNPMLASSCQTFRTSILATPNVLNPELYLEGQGIQYIAYGYLGVWRITIKGPGAAAGERGSSTEPVAQVDGELTEYKCLDGV